MGASERSLTVPSSKKQRSLTCFGSVRMAAIRKIQMLVPQVANTAARVVSDSYLLVYVQDCRCRDKEEWHLLVKWLSEVFRYISSVLCSDAKTTLGESWTRGHVVHAFTSYHTHPGIALNLATKTMRKPPFLTTCARVAKFISFASCLAARPRQQYLNA